MLNKTHHHSGYSLIELVVVIALTAMLLIVATSFFFSTIIAGGKSSNSQEVKQAGQYAMNQITYLIRNARSIGPLEPCDGSSQTTFTIVNQDLGQTTFLAQSVNGNFGLASNSGTLLTPPTISLSAGPSFTCSSPGDGSPPTIQITFTLQKGSLSVNQQRDIVTIPFQSSASIRSY